MKEFFRSDTFKGIRDTVGAILVSLLFFLGINFTIGALSSTAKASDTVGLHEAIEASYKPGIARYVEYDYIRIDGATYIIFRDKYTNSISVVPKY